ncbi:eukaryotic translation initiation factor 2-alpha kinase 1-like [Lingula anatina]|uniref:Eukaryotic translation initiation factor 2-alpha kinase 1 n=1 Tax=Lingula anatina TaxID=7574 RepID=A0A1S3K482_LINAN|nr:eukaryotic translation initiation factor 2-alpha kinase 1-like [Lingula anatina]|eukprot:XP_013417332.1 eukaryotic translation initiation factor 2-alpha kinase 1-like [Lingula anatina]
MQSKEPRGTQTKLKRRTRTINEFDDSDLNQAPIAVSHDTSAIAVPQPHVPNHLLTVSLLELICSIYEPEPRKSYEIFKVLCSYLASLKVMSPLVYLDELSMIRSQYRKQLPNLLRAARRHVNSEFGPPKALPSSKMFPTVNPQESLIRNASFDDLMHMHTSRYTEEFVEQEKLGRGGFGSVYRVKHKLDGCEYAVKKIRLKPNQPEGWVKILREVKVLANLSHQYIVGYNAAWLEQTPTMSAKPPQGPLPSTPIRDLDDMSDSEESSDSNNFDQESFSTSPQDADPGGYGEEYSGTSIVFEDSIKVTSMQEGNLKIETNTETSMRRQVTTKLKYKYSRSPNKTTETSKKVESVKCRSLLPYSPLVPNLNALFVPEMQRLVERTKHMTVDSHEEDDAVFSSTDPTSSATNAESNEPRLKNWSANKTLGTFPVGAMADIPSSRTNRLWQRHHLPRRSQSHEPSLAGDGLIDSEIHSIMHTAVPCETFVTNKVTLYIQMQLCSHTLGEWLSERNGCLQAGQDPFSVVEVEELMWIAKQIFKGAEYIHSQGLIHRDLKPRNIFLHGDKLQVKIGDFGLTREDILLESPTMFPLSPFGKNTMSAAWSSCNETPYTSGIGTSIYAAPEQLAGSCYDSKSDMYSLGVILFELFHPFGTEMERIQCLMALKGGSTEVIPQVIRTNWPIIAQTIDLLTDPTPVRRPSATDVLQSELFLSKDQIIKSLRNTITKQNDEIANLKDKLAEKEALLEALQIDIQSPVV